MDKLKSLKEERDRIVMGLEEAYKRMVEWKRKNNSPIVVSRNGQVVEVNPDEALPTTRYRRD